MIGKLFDVPKRALAGAAALFLLTGLIVLSALTDGAMRPLPASAPAEEFSAERALVHLEEFAAEPRPIGSPANKRARAYLADRLRAAGLEVEVQRAVGARSSTGLATFGQVDNIVARLRGTDSTGTVLIAAHYDSAAMGPGASDDGAAVAAMIETVRALRTGPEPRNDIVLLLSDGEEDGVLGAEAFVREHPLGRGGGVLLNWEARGVSGPSMMFETSKDNAGLVKTFIDAVPDPRGDSSMVTLYRILPNNTDFTPLAEAGFDGMNFAYIERSSHYHTATDDIAHLDTGSLQHHGANMLALARTLGNTDLASLESDNDATYFRVFGKMISYPDPAVLPLAALAVLAVAGLAALGRVRRLLSLPRLLSATLSAAVPLIVSTASAQALWSLLVSWRPSYDLMGGLLHRPQPFRAAVIVLSMLAVLVWYLLLRRKLGPAAMAAGALIWLAGLGLLCAWSAPGMSFLFTLPALLGSLGGSAAVLLTGPAWARTAAALPGPVAAAALLPPLAGNVFDGMGLALGGASALVVALFALSLPPIAELLLPEPDVKPRRSVVLGAPLASAVLAVVLVVVGLAVDGYDAENPKRTHLAYVMDADTRAAHWVSADADPAEWTRRYVSDRDTEALPPGYARGALWIGPAPAIEAAGPRVTVLERRGDTFKLHVAPGKGARSVMLRLDHPITRAAVGAGRFGSVDVPVTGTRLNTWPAEVRFRGIPASGARFTLRVPGADRIRLVAVAETDGLPPVPGFVPSPPELVPATREDGAITAITRGYVLAGGPRHP